MREAYQTVTFQGTHEGEEKTLRLDIYQDSDSGNPRKEFDNVGTFFIWDRNVISPDKEEYSDFMSCVESLAGDYINTEWYSNEGWTTHVHNKYYHADRKLFEEKEKEWFALYRARLQKVINTHYIALSVYSSWNGYGTDTLDIDHTYGIIYCDKKTAIKEWGKGKILSQKARQSAEKYLAGEVKQYSQWAQGEVYGFNLSELIPCPVCNGEGTIDKGTYSTRCQTCKGEGTLLGESIDSVWGFYGDDIRENGILDYIPKEYHPAILAEL